ncbi:MAG TPA: hypothetical protein VNK67_11180 [Burkholderiales bacterium]|nr:hypothetical protein [Burkholderiales bacterium]
MCFRAEAPRAAGLLAALAFAATLPAAREVTVTLGALEAPGVAARDVRLELAGGKLRLAVGELAALGRTWRDIGIACAGPRLGPARIECRDGVLESGTRLPFAFSYALREAELEVALDPAPGERWRLRARFGRAPAARLAIENGDLARLAQWLPRDLPRLSGGRADGSIEWQDSALGARLALREIAFSDEKGLRAGERIGGGIELHAERHGAQWRWRARLDWSAGEAYWQPLYLRGEGHALRAEGRLGPEALEIERGRLELLHVGAAEFGALWDRRGSTLARLDLRSGKLRAGALYSTVLRPFVFGTVLGEARAAGAAEIALAVRRGGIEAAEVGLEDFSFEDPHRRFAVFGANGRVPWHGTRETRAEVAVSGGELLGIPFGAARLPLALRGMHFRLDSVEVPLLDGTLAVRAFAAEQPQRGWRWAFRGSLSPVSMERFAQAAGLPAMHGTISAEIPRVSYERSTLKVDGALLFRVFDGTVTARNVELTDPFGRVPRLRADLEARGLDLDLLTRTFAFGRVTGRVDATVAGLELSGWRPVAFDARIASSPGDYPRRISQSAINSITALGGASAGSAIQGTFLRFFDQFGYEKLGLSCRLRNGVCEMGGIEDAPQGYVIVKGGGIPALTVMGYNRSVNWRELVERLGRVLQDNVRMIVQ